MVALAGPLTNFTIAAVVSPLVKYIGNHPDLFAMNPTVVALVQVMLVQSVIVNVVLGIFNLIPIPPLDGGRIAVGYLPVQLAEPYSRLEPYGFFILIMLLSSGTISRILGPSVEAALKFFLGSV